MHQERAIITRGLRAGVCWAVLFVFVGCASAPMVLEYPPYPFDTSRAFDAPPGEVWDALLTVLEAFPLETVDRDKGIITTEWIDAHAALHLMRYQLKSPDQVPTIPFGLVLIELAPGLPYAAWVVPGSPAADAGIEAREIVIAINGVDTNDIEDAPSVVGEADSLSVTLMARRDAPERTVWLLRSSKPARYAFEPFPSRYRLTFRVRRLDDGRTQVSIANEEYADFNAYAGNDHQVMQAVQSSTIKEWLLLEEVAAELGVSW